MKKSSNKSIRKKYIFLIFTIIAIMFILINPYKIITQQFEKIQQTSNAAEFQTTAMQENERYRETEGERIITKEISYSNSAINEQQLAYEDIIGKNGRPDIIMNQKLAVPYLKYNRANGENSARLDATIENWEVPLAPKSGETVRSLPTGRLFIQAKTGENPFGATGSIVATSRTIAQYKNIGEIDLPAGEAYILTHAKDISFNIDKVQRALWLLRYNGEELTDDFKGPNPESARVSDQLYQEAKKIQEVSDIRNNIKSANNGQEIIDNMAKNNKYDSGEAGIVSYVGKNSEFLVGPFSFNYTQKIIKPKDGGQSEMEDVIDKEGKIVYSAIIAARLYGLVGDKEVEINDWQFVYTDVSYEGINDSVIRNHTKEAKDNGEYSSYMYPFPNETFYIKLPNNEIEAITRIEFDMQSLNAEGRTHVLNGTYSDVNWYAREDQSSYYIEGLEAKKNNASQLYQIKNAKIYHEMKTISLALGKSHQTYGGICIPLTMNFSGMVWYDGTEVDEVNQNIDGTKNLNETPISNVIVRLYRTGKSGDTLVAETKTGEDGRYIFNYIRAGEKYWVEFEYDGMKYKNTYPVYSNGETQYNDCIENHQNYLDKSHAIELAQDRIEFNERFNEITKDTAISINGTTENMDYTYENDFKGQTATVQEFAMLSKTRTANLIYPLHENYTITNLPNSILVENDKNAGQKDEKVMTIGRAVNNKGYVAAAVEGNKKTEGEIKYAGHELEKVYDYLMNINLGLIERDPADFAIKNDITQTRISIGEHVPSADISNFGQKPSSNHEDFDIGIREDGYYNKTYEQMLNIGDYTWRHDFTDNPKDVEILENDELQLYVQYKITIRNQSNLLSGYITELSDYYDKELYYPVNSNEAWKYYDEENNYLNDKTKGYADITIPKLIQYSPSWAIKNNGTPQKENLGAISWSSKSKFNHDNETDLNKMYTTSLEGVKLEPNESIDIFIIFKVNRQENSKFGDGKYIINDNSDTGKRNIVEISGYSALNVDGTVGGRVDIDSNPGNVNINNTDSFEDDSDSAPYLRVLVNAEGNGKSIQGYVWEDRREDVDSETYVKGNGRIDKDENYINNVKVDLVRLEFNKQTGQYEEVKFTDKYLQYAKENNIKLSRYTGPQPGEDESQYVITAGKYVFDNLVESGKYKVRFNYGTEEQLKNQSNLRYDVSSTKYNGHDYKSTEFKGLMGEKDSTTVLPKSLSEYIGTKIVFVSDSSDTISNITKTSIKELKDNITSKLNQTHNQIELVDIMVNDDNLLTYIQQAQSKLTGDIENKIMIIFTDGIVNNRETTKEKIRECLKDGIIVFAVGIEGADEGIFRIHEKDKQVLYYNLSDEQDDVETITNSIYERIVNNIINTMILTDNTSHATDYLETHQRPTTSERVYGRVNVMRNSQIMNTTKAHELDVEYINKLTKNLEPDSEWSKAIKTLADTTRMTADSYEININYDDNIGKITYINLGLQEIPKTQIEVQDKVDNIIVTLSNNKKIINYKENLKQNVLPIKDERYVVYMDEEIMQGATIDVIYKITINNIGEVDNLYSYLKYYSDDIKKEMYHAITGNMVSNNELDQTLKTTVPIRVNNIYSYCDNLTFRAEENNKNYIYDKKIAVEYSDRNIVSLIRDNNHITYEHEEHDQARRERPIWELLDKNFITSKQNPVLNDRIREAISKFNVVRTTSLQNIELYPVQSNEVIGGKEVAAIGVYLRFSKTLSSNDFDLKNALEYNNYVELIETQSITGRRDYEGKVANYQPIEVIEERDTDKAELVQILQPFGDKKIYYVLIATCSVILTAGIIFIKRKVIK